MKDAPRPPEAGLCETCRHRHEIRNRRGSVFRYCRRADDDPSWPRYPRLPVVECAGYERANGE